MNRIFTISVIVALLAILPATFASAFPSTPTTTQVPNSSFEIVDSAGGMLPANWQANTYFHNEIVARDTTTAHTGLASVRLTHGTVSPNDTPTLGSIEFGIQSDLRGSGSAGIFAKGLAGGESVNVLVTWLDSNEHYVGNASHLFQVTPIWQPYIFSVTRPNTAVRGILTFSEADHTAQAKTIWLDDVVLTPATH